VGQDAEELRREIEGTRAEMSSTLDAIGDRVSPGRVIERRKNRMKNAVQSVSGRVMGAASDKSAHLSQSASSGKEHLSQAASSGMDTIHGLPDTARSRAQGSPMGAGAVAFGIGFLAAAIFPPSQKEEAAVGSLLDSDKIGGVQGLQEKASGLGQELKDHLQEPAMQAAGTVKEAVTQSAGAVKETATNAVGSAKDETKGAMQS
jgi:hypothetical protein